MSDTRVGGGGTSAHKDAASEQSYNWPRVELKVEEFTCDARPTVELGRRYS